MFRFSKNHSYPIGVDMGDNVLKLVQLENKGKGMAIVASGSENRPDDITPGSVDWQRWAIKALERLTSNGGFLSKEIVAALPSSELFIDHIKMPKTNGGSIEDAIISKIRQKLPFDSADAMIRYICVEDDNVVVVTTERKKIDRYLAIYEKANLNIKSIGVWPLALINCYTKFFGRRKTDVGAIVMLLNMEDFCTNVVICRHKNLLFARSIPIGTGHLETDEMINKLALELQTCKQHFSLMYRKSQIERLIFLSSLPQPEIDENINTTIAKKLEMPAQIGNCLAAAGIVNPSVSEIDRRIGDSSQEQQGSNWVAAFGLSLS